MKIATYNVNSINARLENLTTWLFEENPDIILLQEIKCDYNNFPFFDFRAIGYNILMLGQKSYNGVAVLSRYPMSLVCEGLPDFTDENARYIEVDISTPTEVWRLASIYLPNRNPPYNNVNDQTKYIYKLNWMDAFLSRAIKLEKLPQPVVLGGDFNVILTENDVYNPKAFVDNALFRKEVRQKLQVLQYYGYYDAFRILHKNENGYTFWNYTDKALVADFGMRIDYFFLNALAADKLLTCNVDKKTRQSVSPSDHAPLIAQFNISKIQEG